MYAQDLLQSSQETVGVPSLSWKGWEVDTFVASVPCSIVDFNEGERDTYCTIIADPWSSGNNAGKRAHARPLPHLQVTDCLPLSLFEVRKRLVHKACTHREYYERAD